MSDTVENPLSKNQHELRAGLNVTTISIWIIFSIVVILLTEIIMVETKFTPPNLSGSLAALCDKNCTPEFVRLLMDQDAQILRTDRVRTTMVSRLMIFVVAEIVALLLVSLGAVLIFNRIESTKGETTINYRDLFFSTSFPGLIMCAIGATVLVTSLFLASNQMLVTVYDRPVYTSDENYGRNAMGFESGQKPGEAAQNAPRLQEIPLFPTD